MIFNRTPFYRHLTPAGLLELKELASKYGMTVSDICRLGYDAETGPHRYHLLLTDAELSWLNTQAAEQGLSRSQYLMQSFDALIDDREKDLIALINEQEFHRTSDMHDVCVSFNYIDFMMKLDRIESKTMKPKNLIIKTLFTMLRRKEPDDVY